ncbi:MAG: ISAs1 family transposase [Rhodobacteraceae bacterium]|nr:ISAs1 family transposase [Paracoccaceae bacterium]MCB1401333.1 ISAs1 family transposase [Paracoccaceae bacterium]
MIPSAETLPRKSRLAALLDQFALVEDPRDVRRITHRLDEILLLVVCGTIADCDDYEDIAAWGKAHLGFLRRHLPYEHGVPGERWLTILMNRINPALFAAAFAAWVRESWPGKASLVAIDGKTSRRSHDRGAGAGPLHLVSAFATTARLVLAQEAVPDKANELAAIPPLLERLGAEDGLKGALVSIDAIATNAEVAQAITDQGADYLLAVKANQPTLRAEVEAAFAEAGELDTHADLDKGHGRIEERRTTVLRDTDWLEGARRFPGELRLPKAACLVRAETRVETRVESKGAPRAETRYFISSRALTPHEAATVVREHWAIENRLHWVLDVTFADDQSRLRKGHGARNMATVRHFALNLVRTATDKRSIKSRRKIAGWDPDYLDTILASRPA